MSTESAQLSPFPQAPRPVAVPPLCPRHPPQQVMVAPAPATAAFG